MEIENVKEYLAIIFINGGSSFASASNAFEAIENCKKVCEADWGSMYVFSDDVTWINVYDFSESEGWYASCGNGPKDRKTKEPLPYLYSVSLKLKNKRSAKKRA